MTNDIDNNGLSISDLSYLQEFAQENTLVGGFADPNVYMNSLPYVDAQAHTTALPGLGTADAFAFAAGSMTRTEVQTSVETMVVDNFHFTTADAMASAYARTGYHTERIDSYSLSLSFSNISKFNTTI